MSWIGTGPAWAATAAAALLLLAGCGSATGAGVDDDADDPTGSAAVSGQGRTQLTISWDDGTGRTGTWHLTCDPAGGDHPRPEAACRALAKGGAVGLAPVQPGRMCSQVFGGSQTATVTGTWRGRPVSVRLTRTDGCEVGRWDALKGLLPDA